MRRFGIALSLLMLAIPAFAQQQPALEERIDVNAVLLDVIVTDSKGNHILGLGKEDFVVREDGVDQPVDSVDYFTNRRLLDAREETAPFKVEHVREDRYFIFFFDKPNEPSPIQAEISIASDAVREFVRNEMREMDRVAIVGHDVRLKVYTDFTTDKKQIERALSDAVQFGRGITKKSEGEGASILRSLDLEEMMDHTGTVYQAIDLLADATRSIRARKNLVLFSPGIMDRHEQARAGLITVRSPYLDPMLESLNAANVSVYGVQLQRGDVSVDANQIFHQRLEEMSESTGGRYFRFNTSFKPALERVEHVNSGYYLVTYRAQHAKGQKGFQKVDVKVRNPELRVVARSGYSFGS